MSEWRTKTVDEIRQDMRDWFAEASKKMSEPLPPYAPMPTYEEMTAALHRLANPTPADRAVEMLNGERVMRVTRRQ